MKEVAQLDEGHSSCRRGVDTYWSDEMVFSNNPFERRNRKQSAEVVPLARPAYDLESIDLIQCVDTAPSDVVLQHAIIRRTRLFRPSANIAKVICLSSNRSSDHLQSRALPDSPSVYVYPLVHRSR